MQVGSLVMLHHQPDLLWIVLEKILDDILIYNHSTGYKMWTEEQHFEVIA